MLVYGLRIHHDYAILTACRPAASPACQGLSSYFNSTDWHLGNYLADRRAGRPGAARDVRAARRWWPGSWRTGTYRYAWTQGIGRVRWTVAKLVILGAVVTIVAFVISQLFDLVLRPVPDDGEADRLTPSVFDTQRRLYAAWTLTAFCLGAFLGTLLRQDPRRRWPSRSVVYVALTALTWFTCAATTR